MLGREQDERCRGENSCREAKPCTCRHLDDALSQPRAVSCDLIGHAVVRTTLEGVAPLRRQPGPVCGGPLPASFLKHADEQTVVGLAAVYQAIQDAHLCPDGDLAVFRTWGALAAPRFLGRPTLVSALQRFAAEGAWGVSPHLIPHRSLHAISGTVSQALKIYGPNFGVGGGPSAAAEVLLAAAAMLECQGVPGAWVVLTGYDPECAPDAAGRLPAGTACVGLALALTPPRPHWTGPRLRISIASERFASAPAKRGGELDLVELASLLRAFSSSRSGPMTVLQSLEDMPGHCCRLELSRGQHLNGESAGHRRNEEGAGRPLWREAAARGYTTGANGSAATVGPKRQRGTTQAVSASEREPQARSASERDSQAGWAHE
jgi:hypothetical protein